MKQKTIVAMMLESIMIVAKIHVLSNILLSYLQGPIKNKVDPRPHKIPIAYGKANFPMFATEKINRK